MSLTHIEYGFEWHEHRHNIYAELHSRPFKIISSDAHISHVALLTNEKEKKQQRQHLLSLLKQLDIDVERIEGSCQVYQGKDFIIRYENHLEFSTLTITDTAINTSASEPFAKTALHRLPQRWFADFPGKTIAAFHMQVNFNKVTSFPKPQKLKPVFDHKLMVGSLPQHGAAQVWTSFHTHDDNFGRFLIFNHHMSKGQMGRMVQRIIEIETYRLMAMLGFMEARALTPELASMDHALADITDQLANGSASHDDDLLKALTDLAATIEAIRAKTTFRFNASLAYHGVMMARINELKEDEVSGHLTIKEFLTRRLTPAVNSCSNAQDRLENLSKRVNRASDMLRTRVELSIQSQNQQLLSSLERRSRLQLALQHTVEGLSVAAISYYTVGLIKYLTDAIYNAGFAINKPMIMGITVPVIIGIVWFMTKRVHKKIRTLAHTRNL